MFVFSKCSLDYSELFISSNLELAMGFLLLCQQITGGVHGVFIEA